MKDPLDLDVFHEKGFVRKTCKICGAKFWTLDKSRETCGEFPCDPYLFLEKPIMNKKLDFFEMMDEFLHFFERHGHKIIERYPVVARWRKDVFLVNASIYDFQPHVTSGQVPPPANPLVVPQPCIRMVDIDDVGRTGRHLTSFIMLGHHAFNYPDKFIYWKDETVSYALGFLSSLGVDPKLVTFKEKPWVGGGNGGYAMEVIVAGLELATLVFMDMKEDPEGDIEIEGLKFKPMPMKVVDTGYGLERFVWASKVSPSVFDAIYSDLMDFIFNKINLQKPEKYDEIVKSFVSIKKKDDESLMIELGQKLKEKNIDFDYRPFIEKLRKVHMVVDHSRTVLFMLNDGIVPSNTKAGYLARLMIRRLFKVLEDLGLENSLQEIMEFQRKRFSRMLDDSMFSVVMDILSVEWERYSETKVKGLAIIDKILKKGNIDLNSLVDLYDTYGIQPELVAERAKSLGIEIKVPENFRSLVASKHERNVEEKKEIEKTFNLPPTEMLYENAYLKEFDANVIYVENNMAVLDRTAFYPEGGGQPADHGYLEQDGKKVNVLDVQKFGNVIVHYIDGTLDKGKVRGYIDWDRRSRLMKNHTATHIILYSCRKVLGKHIWQAGAQKDVYASRLDITHYRKITRDEIKKIEKVAMDLIMENIDVTVQWMDRNEAEKLYGFKLYEGGIPPGEKIRVVKIGDYDVEGCGGTHVKKTGEIGFVKILKEERIQDGVSRIMFTSGFGALEHVQYMEDILNDASDILKVETEKLPNTVQRFFNEWKDLKKFKEKAEQEMIKYYVEKIKENPIVEKNIKIYLGIVPKDYAMRVAKQINEKNSIAIINSDSMTIVADNSGMDIIKKLKTNGKISNNILMLNSNVNLVENIRGLI